MTRSKNNTHKELKERWIAVKQNLFEDSDFGIEEVYSIYFERIENRYFKPIELLKIDDDSSDGYGFSMIAISCSLIEFLQSTIDGKFDEKSYKYEFVSKYPLLVQRGVLKFYGKTEKNTDNQFVLFLKKLDSNFEVNPTYSEHYDSVAREFYSCVRCALLHDACTSGNWIIREKSDKDLIFDISNPQEKILYRNNFYEKIYEKVKNDMRKNFTNNIEFRKNLLKKMDIIFETANYIDKDEIPFWWN